MSMASVIDPKDLLGKAIDAPDVVARLSTLDPQTKVTVTSLKEPRWISKAAGMVVYAEKVSSRITTVFLYSEGEDKFTQYKHPLPHGIQFSMGKAEATRCVPMAPNFSSPAHDAWDFEDHRLVVQYRAGGSPIKKVSLTTAF
jgi:hypothetical protein